MRDYAKVSPLFWTGSTGKEIRGNGDAQRVAFYLFTCPNSNMLGLYYLAFPTLLHEIGISKQGASKALRRLSEAQFGYYDAPSEYVWVPEMARIQVAPQLKPGDNRIVGIENDLEQHRKSPFFNNFLTRYREAYHLKTEPNREGPIKPLRSPSGGPPKQGEGKGEGKGEGRNTGGGADAPSYPPMHDTRTAFGEFGWARMKPDEFEKLGSLLGVQRDDYIQRFDGWVHEAPDAKHNGVRRKDRNAYPTIQNWFRRDHRAGSNGQTSGLSPAEVRDRRRVETTQRAVDEVFSRASKNLPD